MNLAVARQLACIVVSLAAGTCICLALTLAELERLLQSTAATQAVPFHEVRESSWMSAPVESRGTLRSSPGRLEKRVESPRQETWLILDDRMEWIGPNAESKRILFSGAPAVAALAHALRSAVAGDSSMATTSEPSSAKSAVKRPVPQPASKSGRCCSTGEPVVSRARR